MRRNRLLVGAAALAAALAGCKRAPPPADAALPAGEVKLAAPAPAGVGLAAETTSYTNEMQAANLREQAAELGISRLTRPSDQTADPDEARPMISYEEGLERTRELSQEFEAQRHAIDRDKRKTVTLPGTTPGMLPGKKEGAPVEPAPEGPEEK
ncbi:MAG: hypothetical protein HY079_11050 [Elusimicrobia bacterium]|nr:hypothetical protein [Elusimicrobiota bacterium]